jgi:hypothetical protein
MFAKRLGRTNSWSPAHTLDAWPALQIAWEWS